MPQTVQFRQFHIVYPAATAALHMVMSIKAAVKPVAGIGHVNFTKQAMLCQKIEIAVYCSQTDGRMFLLQAMVYLIGRRMNGICFHRLVDQLPLL